MQINEMMLGII